LVEPVTPLSIAARLDLVESSGTATATATRLARQFHRTVAEQFNAANDELVERLITHIAMALTRIERGEGEAELPEVAAAELDGRVAERDLAAGYCDQWEAELGRSIPQSERDYLAMYLAALSDAHVQ
jgi:transcriptional regulatory protein LevR